MDILTADFETYYHARDFHLGSGVGGLTTEEYVRDPRFQALMCGVRFPDGRLEVMDEPVFAQWVLTVDWKSTALLCHHAHFDGAIFAWRYGVVPAFYFDTLSMARALHGTEVGNSLGKLMERYEVGHKGQFIKEGGSSGKHREDFAPGEWEAFKQYCAVDVEGTWQLFLLMLPSFPEDELALIDLTVRMFTVPALEADQDVYARCIAMQTQQKDELLARVGLDRKRVGSNAQFMQALLACGVEPPMKPSPTSGEPIPAFARNDPGMQALLNHPREEIRWLAQARLGVKSGIMESRAGRLMQTGQRGRVPVYLKYAGAHTLRWGGGDKMNLQNLPKRVPWKQDAGMLREGLRAPKGMAVVVADSAQIEARMLAWEADQMDLVGQFARGEDVYSKFASLAYGREIDRKKNPADETARTVGKICVLGLGYGMGWYHFALGTSVGLSGNPAMLFTADDVKIMGVDTKAFDAVLKANSGEQHTRLAAMPSRHSVEVLTTHCSVCWHLVRKYRGLNAQIVAFWGLCDELIGGMVRGVQPVNADAALLRVGVGELMLPSGMPLRYPELKVSLADEATYWAGKHKTKLFGSMLAENITQRLARDVVAGQMLEIHRAGIPVVLMTHDEIVMVVPEHEAEQTLEFALGAMRKAPIWAEGLPLNAEGGIGPNYLAAKH